jgi:16S rRNA (cytosine1407-C5)-methyltransferase
VARDDFERFYTELYGPRWTTLRPALLEPSRSIAFADGLTQAYALDRASVLAARTLRLPPGGLILDACAAPGGKSLVIASRMDGAARLLANELSNERRRRLSDVLKDHLDPETRSRLTVSGFDAAAAAGRAGERERFDAILVDAPCSSERHVLASGKALAEWTPARPRSLATRQWALLSAAFLLLKTGGSLVYATCAVNPGENDGISARLIAKYGRRLVVDVPEFTEGEATDYGRIILPDRDGGLGPMYVARFRKIPPPEEDGK